ncbi:hypothetical protein ACQJBY_042181 [Aegilops geniculata]
MEGSREGDPICISDSEETVQTETNGLSLKTQEIESIRKWEAAADLSRRFCSNQHESPWEGGTAKHIACHSSGYQGHPSQEWPPWNDGSLTTTLGEVLTPDKSSPIFKACKTKNSGKRKICFTCREEGHYNRQCPQNLRAMSANLSKVVEEYPPCNDGSLTTSLGRQSSNQHKSPWEGGTTEHIACHSSGYQGQYSQEWLLWNYGLLTTLLGWQKDFRFFSNQHESPWEGGKTEHIACHSSGYQGHYSQEWPPRNYGSLTTSLGRQKDFHFCSSQRESPWEGGKTEHQDKINGIITCLVCGKEGHYSCDCPFKDQEHKVICTLCSKNGHCSMWCCQQNKSESRACTRCGEIGHTASTHGLGCSSCDEYHLDGECRLSEVKCFVCECQDHYLAQCPLNFQGALRLALSKRGSTSSAPAKCSAKSEGKVLRADGSSPICFTCREEGHFAFQCPQNSPSVSEEFEESSTIATATNLSKELEGQDPGTAKQSSETKPILYDQCCPSKAKVLTSNKSSPMVRTCKTKTEGEKMMCSTCREEGHYARMCPQKFGAISGNTSKELEESSTIATSSNMSKVLEEQDPGTAKHSSDMKWVLRCASCGQEGHRARSCPTRVFICSLCNEEGHKAKKCPQKRQKR